MKQKNVRTVFMNGILGENPTFRMLLGMCPTLAVSTAVIQGIGMGLAATFVLVFSNLVIALLRNIIPDKVRIPAFVVIIATFVTIIDLISCSPIWSSRCFATSSPTRCVFPRSS